MQLCRKQLRYELFAISRQQVGVVFPGCFAVSATNLCFLSSRYSLSIDIARTRVPSRLRARSLGRSSVAVYAAYAFRSAALSKTHALCLSVSTLVSLSTTI